MSDFEFPELVANAPPPPEREKEASLVVDFPNRYQGCLPFQAYLPGDEVLCENCGQALDKASKANIVGFGEGYGNRDFKCPNCRWSMIFDIAPNADFKEKWNTQHAEFFVGRLKRMRSYWSKYHKPTKPVSAFDLAIGS